MKNKNVILYSVLAIALSVGAYYVITAKKSDAKTPKSDKKEETNEDTTTSSTGQQISVDQVKIPPKLAEILKLTSAQATKLLKGKSIFTKLSDTNVRSTPNVNNGAFINNITGKIVSPGINCGVVTAVVDDANGLMDSSGKVYKWIKFTISPEAKNTMNRDKDFLAAKLVDSIAYTGYLREDTITI